MDAERAHDLTIALMHKYPLFSKVLAKEIDHRLTLKVGSLNWKSPVGLAAGLDKNALAYDFLSHIGFGAVEVGTVTPRPQAGNEKPRLFRYPEEKSLRNCMGFNNEGSAFLLNEVQKIRYRNTPLGINIGKNKLTADDKAQEDYAYLYNLYKDVADYIVINVSSPNTPGLRSHQTKEALATIFNELDHKKSNVDLYVKIAPDIEEDEIKAVCETAKKYDLTGVVATNTTIMPERGVGGISGDLLYNKAKNVRRSCIDILKEVEELEFIGVGGFSNYEQLKDFWKDGGKAIQLYSSFIFNGPKMLSDINNDILFDIQKHGVKDISELIESYQA